jgi:response regulator of citrate/malate metabolism
MPAYAARENAACRPQWDANRIGLGQGQPSARLNRVDQLEAYLASNPGVTLEQIASAIGTSKTTASNYIGALNARGQIARKRLAGLYRYSLKEPQA